MPITERDQLPAALQQAAEHDWPLLLLGGGSNVVLREDFAGLCVLMQTRGIAAETLDETWVEVTVAAGEPWHQFVDQALTHGWYGLENLALIPGTVGAAPIQNIGAYGVEVKDFIHSVEVLDRDTGAVHWMDHSACGFGYRDSVFKHQLRDRVIILAVRFRLRRYPQLNLSYQGLQDALAAYESPTPRDLFNAVVKVRQAKLPDPAQLPNAGSFFKNPVVTEADYAALKAQYPQLVGYPDPQGVKLAAGWLIDQAGWKGHQDGPVGVHQQQALVLTHRGGGDGRALLALAARIQADILARFGVTLEIEPRIY